MCVSVCCVVLSAANHGRQTHGFPVGAPMRASALTHQGPALGIVRAHTRTYLTAKRRGTGGQRPKTCSDQRLYRPRTRGTDRGDGRGTGFASHFLDALLGWHRTVLRLHRTSPRTHPPVRWGRLGFSSSVVRAAPHESLLANGVLRGAPPRSPTPPSERSAPRPPINPDERSPTKPGSTCPNRHGGACRGWWGCSCAVVVGSVGGANRPNLGRGADHASVQRRGHDYGRRYQCHIWPGTPR